MQTDRKRWVLRCFRKVFKVWDERRVGGREFQTVGAAIWNERKPKWRLVRGTYKYKPTACIATYIRFGGIFNYISLLQIFRSFSRWNNIFVKIYIWQSYRQAYSGIFFDSERPMVPPRFSFVTRKKTCRYRESMESSVRSMACFVLNV